MSIKPKDVTCPWCETHKLEAHVGLHGVSLHCSDPGDFNCPDTTGTCETLDVALEHAKVLCAPIGCWPKEVTS